MTPMNNRIGRKLAPWILLLAILVVWQAICSLFAVSEFIFPGPLAIARSMVEFAGPIAANALHTFWVPMLGFGLAVGAFGSGITMRRFLKV